MTADQELDAARPSVLRRAGGTVAPMSFAQERLWLIDLAAPGSPSYNVPLLTRWNEPIDPAALAAALGHVVARHEVLRTTYSLRDDQPVQVVGEPTPVAVEVIDIDAGAGDDAAAQVDAQVDLRARLPFDLATGPVLRCTVWRGVPDGDLMLLVAHHIAIDGWSLAAFYADLAAAYGAAVAGQPPSLPALPIQYSDFARWDRESFAGPRRQHLSTRAAELQDVSELILAGARPGPVAPEGDRPGRQRTFEVSPRLWSGVQELSRALRATPFVILQAAFQTVVQRWSGRQDFVVGAVTANRPLPEVEPLVGFFVNTVPMRCRVSPGWTFAELCAKARAEAYRLLTYQWIPFDRLTSEVAAIRTGGHHHLVNVCFALQNMPAPRIDPTRWAPPVVLPTGTAKFDLLLVVEQTQTGVVGTVEYDTDRYPDAVCDGVIQDFLAVAGSAVSDASVPLHRMPLAGGSKPAGGHAGPVDYQARSVDRAEHQMSQEDLAVHQRRAAELFADALRTIDRGRSDASISAASDFFALGGHSLLAVTMLAQARRRYAVPVSPRDFLADPTVRGLARLLAAAGAPTAAPEGAGDLEPAGAGTEADRQPATSAQQRFWFLDRVPALRAAYLMPTVVELLGEVEHAALRWAVDRVVAHHPALRSRFELDREQRRVFYRTDGEPVPAARTDASSWTPARLRQHLADLCWTGFDLAGQAPVRAEIIACGTGRTLLVLVLHHIVADGASRNLLLDQIVGAYRARLAGEEPPLPAATRPGGVHPVRVEEQTAALIGWLEGAPGDVWLPHDRPRPEVQSTLAASTSVILDTGLTARLRARAAESACTSFLTTAALLGVTLARRSAQRDFVFAFPWNGRDAPGSEEAVGMLVNTLALRVDLRGVRTWLELLARIRDSGAIAYRNADALFDEVVAALHPDRDLSRPALTPVFLNAERAPLPPLLTDEVLARYLPLDPLHIKYELELTATDHRDRLELGLCYAVDLFDADTIRDLVAQLVAAAEDLATDPEQNPLPGRRDPGERGQ